MKKNQKGVSLITVLVAVGIISIAAAVFMQMSGNFIFGSSRIEKGLKGQAVLTGVASELQKQDFDFLVTKLCKLDANNPEVNSPPKNCVENGKLKALADQTPPPAGQPLINVLLSENGKPSDKGDNCVEITQCKLLADGNMLELALMAYWTNTDPSKPLLSRATVLRRARW